MIRTTIPAERFVDLCILHLLGRDPDPATRASGLKAYERDGESGVVRALVANPEFVQAHYDRIVQRSARTLPGIDLAEDVQRELVRVLAGYMGAMPWRDEPKPGLRYRARNQYFPGGDAMLLYGILRRFRPNRIVEIGSGFSSAVMLDTDEHFMDKATNFDFVEPHPDRLRQLVGDCDAARVRIHQTTVQDAPQELFTTLVENDVLFVDSSHVVKFGSDLLHIMNEILPRLARGVLVHFHDIFWPFDYPKSWYALGRAWNEAFALRHFLMFNPLFRIICFADWLKLHERPLLDAHLPLLPHYDAGSLWLVRVR